MTELLDESIGPQWGELIVYDREDREKGSFPVVSNTLIGRCKDCDIRIRRPDVSREHAVISFENNRAWLTQLSNTNATRINRKPISKGSICLRDGDVLHISDRKMMFVYDERFKGFGTPEALNQVPEEFQGSNDYDSLDQTMAFDTLNVLKENNQPSLDAPSSVKKNSHKSAKKTPGLTPSSRKTSMDADAARASLIRQQLDALREKSHIAQSKFAAQFLTEEESTSSQTNSVDENQINTAAQIVDEDNGTFFVDENDENNEDALNMVKDLEENDVDVNMDNVDSVSNHKNTLPTPIRHDIQSKRQSFVPHEDEVDSDGASAHYAITPPDSKTSNRATSRKSACRSASRINARHSLGGVSLASFFSAAEAEAEAAEEAEVAAQNELDQTFTFVDDEDVEMTPSMDENRMMMVNVSNGPSETFMQETETTVELSSEKTPKSSTKMANAISSNKKTPKSVSKTAISNKTPKSSTKMANAISSTKKTPKSVSKTSQSTTRPSTAKNVKLQGTTTRRSSLDSVVSIGNMFQTSEDENDTVATINASTTTTELNPNTAADVQDKESITNQSSKSKALNTPIRRAIRARRKSYSRSFMTQRQPDTIKEHDDDDDDVEENDQDMMDTNNRLSVSSTVHDTQTKLVEEFENVGQETNTVETNDELQQKTPVKTNAKQQHRLKTPIRHEVETYSVRHSRVIRKPPRTSIGSTRSTTMDKKNNEEKEEQEVQQQQEQQMYETSMETEPVPKDAANNSADIVDADMELTTALTNHKPLATPLRKAIMARRKSYGPHVSLFSPDRIKTPSESVNSNKKQTRRSSLVPSSASRRSSLLPSSSSASRRSSTHRRVSFGTSSVISVGELFETEDAQQLEDSGIFSYQAVSSEEGNIHLFFDNDGSIVRSVFEPIDSTLTKSDQEKSLADEENSASLEENSMHVQSQETLDETKENSNSIEWEDLSMEEVSDLIVSGAIPSLPISIKRAIHSLRSPTGKHTISGGMHSRYAARKSMGLGSGTDRPNSHLVFDENADENDTIQQDAFAVSSSMDSLNKDTNMESMHSRYAARRSMGMGSGRGRPNKHVLLDENQDEYKIVANVNDDDDEGQEAEEDKAEKPYDGDEIDDETHEIIEEDDDLEDEEEAEIVDTSMHDEAEKETQQFHSKYAARASLGLGNGEGRPNRHVIFTDGDNHSDIIETNDAEQSIDADTDNHSDIIETNDAEQGIDASSPEDEINSSGDKIATMILSKEEQPLRQSIADAISQEESHTSDSDSVDRVIEYETAAEQMPVEQVKENVNEQESDQENELEAEEEIEQEIEEEQIDSNKDQFNVENQQPTQEDETTPADTTLEQVPFADEEEEEEEIYLFEPQLETIQETDIETELESAAPHSAFTRRTRHTTTPSTMHRSRRIGTTFATSPNEQTPGEKRQLSFEMNESNMPIKKRARHSLQSNNQTTQQEECTDSYEIFQRMTVAKLQKQLKQQGLSTAGRKAELIDRLMTAQLDNVQEATETEISSSSSSNIPTKQQQQQEEEAKEEPIDTEMTQAEESMSQEEDTSTESDKEEELTAADIQRMKVVELRAELAARDLSTAGRKADLMDRLLNAIDSTSNDDDASEDENDENIQEEFESKNIKDIEENDASEDKNDENTQDIEENDASMKWSEEELSSMTVVQLRNELKSLGLEVAGRKADLIQRLMESFLSNNDDEEENANANASTNNTPEEEEEANDLPEDLQALKVVELRQLLSERELSTSGRKAELIARLEETRA